MVSAEPTSRRWQVLVWVGALIPLLFFGWLYQRHRLPPEVRASALRLDGDWKVVAGDPPGAGALELDDSTAPTMKVPGSYFASGVRAPISWLRRRFILPPGMEREWLFFMLGDTRGALAQIYVNGERVGEMQRFARGAKTQVADREGWAIPAGYLRPGENVIALRFEWGLTLREGINNPEVLLGPHRLLGAHFTEVSDLRRQFQYGTAILMLFLVVLFACLSLAEWSTPNRALYLSCIALLAAALSYVGVLGGVIIRVPEGANFTLTLIYLSILAVTCTQADFVSRYYLGGRSLFRRLNAWGAGLFTAAYVVPSILRRPDWTAYVFDVMSVVMLAPIVYCAGLAVASLTRRARQLDPILVSGIVISAFTGGTDMLKSLRLISGPYMYQLGISACAVMAAVVLIVDFTRISFDNKELSSSLQRGNAELADALVKAQETSRLKSEFVASVSHELRTPLNAVINIPEALLGQFRPAVEDVVFEGELSRMEDSLKLIHRSGRNLLRLIDDVLDFSKLEAGRAKLLREPLRLSSALADVAETLQPLAATRGITLRIHVGEGPTLLADPVKFSQVLVNLLGNAIKFSPPQSEVWVQARVRHDAAAWEIAVRDQGIGIAREHQETIFESFRQVDAPNTRRFGGTGLGLAISRKLVEAHGGSIRVESEPGKGSTFFVCFPLDGAAAKPLAIAS